jgi:hypothetical protein
MNAISKQEGVESYDKSLNMDKSKISADNSCYDITGLIPNEPPMLDPLEFSSNRLEDALNMFCDFSNTTTTTVQTAIDNRSE